MQLHGPPLLLVAPVLLLPLARGMQESLTIEDDYRLMIDVDTFGFDAGGVIDLKMTGLVVRAQLLKASSAVPQERSGG